jgi:hypothetical protein
MSEHRTTAVKTDAAGGPGCGAALLQRECACGETAGLDDRCEDCREERLTGQMNALQPKLHIGPADDEYERQADRVADSVMRMPVAGGAGFSIEKISPLVQRQAEEDDEELQAKFLHRQVEEEEGDEEETLQMQAIQRQVIDEDEEVVQRKRAPDTGHGQAQRIAGVGVSGGQPLPTSVRGFFEPRFGFDFSRVRVYTSADAAASARAVGAKAYTIGRNVVFGAGRWAPETAAGARLLAHELTHVVQQGAAGPHAAQRIQREPAAEAAANAAPRAPYYIAFTHGTAPPEPDHSQVNPGPSNSDADHAGYVRARLRRHLSAAWDFGTATGEGADRTVPVSVRSANITFNLDPIEVFVSSRYAVGSCPYRVTLAHELEHVRAYQRIFREHRQSMIDEANSVPLPTTASPQNVPAGSVGTEQDRILEPVVDAINRVRATILSDMNDDREEKDSAESYQRVFDQCPDHEW